MVKITIELSEQDIEEIINEIEEDEKQYSKQEMISANQDELEWYNMFVNKYYTILRQYPEMLNELCERILVGEKVVNDLEME